MKQRLQQKWDRQQGALPTTAGAGATTTYSNKRLGDRVKGSAGLTSARPRADALDREMAGSKAAPHREEKKVLWALARVIEKTQAVSTGC